MEQNTDFRGFCSPSVVLDTVAEQLTDSDITLPDYCPDIEKILKCTLVPKIQSKTLSGGQLQVDGFCVINVLYVEGEKKTIRCFEQSVNFSQSFAVRDPGESFIVLTKTKPEYINCRALSPRRLVIHGAFSLYAKVISAVKTTLYTPGEGLEVNREKVKIANLTANCQEQFTVSEELSVADKPEIEAVLYSSVCANVTDYKAVSGKLMINGEITLRLFYLTNLETGETAKLSYVLPFQQIIDCDGIEEEAEALIDCEVMSYDVRLKNDILSDKPAVALDVRLCVSAEGFMSREEDIVTDAYSTRFASSPQFETLKTVEAVCPVNVSHMEKLSAKIGDGKLSKVLDIYADNVTLESKPAENGMTLSGKINLCILALDENGAPVFAERSAEYSRELSSECGTMLFDCPCVSGISFRLSDDNSVEIRCELKISGGAAAKQNVKAVSSVDVFEDKPLAKDSFALTLYFASAGESLWDIAKRHKTKLDALLEENSLEELKLSNPQMLLIPKL